MEALAQHVSPDGLLTLNVQEEGDDVIVGFNAFAWSISIGFLASNWGVSRDAAVTRFLSELLDNRAIIAIASVGPAIRDVWVTDRPASDLKFRRHEETLTFRLWSGLALTADDLPLVATA